MKELKDRIRPEIKLAIFSNASRVIASNVVDALSLMDAPMMKLDAGDEVTFLSINRPTAVLPFAEIIKGLKSVPKLMIQSALIDGVVSNIRGDAYEAWVAILTELKPKKVHLYSTERPTANESVKCVSPQQLQSIEMSLRSRFGLDVKAFWQD